MKRTTTTPKLLASADAARLLGVSPASVRLYARFGQLRVAQRTVGGVRLFERADVLALKRKRGKR